MEDYTLKEELGQGSFGIVYKATNKRKDTVAVKFLQNLPKSRKFTQRELEIIDKDLDHENIVSITEHFVFRGRIYIVMEFCEGGDLNDYITKNEPELNERFNLMTDMARGVLYLHNQNIVHRDLKPENVLLTNTGQRYICKITDFGLSRIKDRKQEMFSTQCGSLAYTAPEVTDGKPYSISIDTFALGLIYFAVYKLIIVENSFDERSLIPAIISAKRHDFLNYIIRKEQPSESRFIEHYFEGSVGMGRLVYSMIRVEPDDRLVMDKVLIGIAEERLRNSLNDGMVEKEQSIMKCGSQEQENRSKCLEAALNNQQDTIRTHEDTIKKQLDTIREQKEAMAELINQNATLEEELKKYKDMKSAKNKDAGERKDRKGPSKQTQAVGGARLKVSYNP